MESEEISFEDLGLDDITLAAIGRKGFKTPSPIQALAIPRLLNGDTNLIAKARTGTGKTAAFGLPLVQKLREKSDHVRALILEPTRELAVQTCTEMQSFTTGEYPKTTVLYGGASYGEQIRNLRRGIDIVVGTPGRIQDHIERGTLNIEKIDYFILDEGDEMLDMGFIDDIEAIFSKANPDSRILLFSATIPAPILKIAQKFRGEYEIIEEEGVTEEPLLIDQKYWVVKESEKIEALVRLIDMSSDFYGLVFTQTKADADLVSRQLDERGYEAAALHGDIPQGQREKILARFRSKKTRILVATDVAARGIDISGLSHVVNYSLPFDGSTYVHRIGRTGRAGAAGCAFTFVCPNERRKLSYLQSAVRKASKGDMTLGTIPSVDSVLEIKRDRMFTEMKESLGLITQSQESSIQDESDLSSVDSFNDEIIPLQAQSEDKSDVSETADTTTTEGVSPIETPSSTATMEQYAPATVEQHLITYGKSLDKSHYGHISSQGDFGGKGSSGRGGDFSNQVRVYVQLGRRDGYNARSIADYFSSLLHIPGRMVDRIDVSNNFSLVSLPTSDGKKVLEMARRDRGLPHMHLDTKDGGNGGNFRSHDRFAVGRDRKGKGHDKGRSDSYRSGGHKSSHGRVNPHVPTERTGSASLYKKHKGNAETF